MPKAVLRGLLGLALLAAVLALADPARVAAQLGRARPLWLAAGLLAAIASNAVSALRWRALARWLGAEVGARDACRWYFQAMGLNALLPGAVLGGDVYRAVVLRRAGQASAAAGWSVVLDRASGLWMLCAIGGLGAAACAEVLAPWLRLPAGAFAALLLPLPGVWLLLLCRPRRCGRGAGLRRAGAGRGAAGGRVGLGHRSGVPAGGAARERGRLGHARGGGRGRAGAVRRGGAGGRGRGRDLWPVRPGAGRAGGAGVRATAPGAHRLIQHRIGRQPR